MLIRMIYGSAGGFILLCCGLASASRAMPQSPTEGQILSIRTSDGQELSGLAQGTLAVDDNGKPREFKLQQLLSYNAALPASKFEEERIATDLPTLSDTDTKKAETAAEELTNIGLPVITPLLRSYVDTDAHEPDLRYRLFGRIMPGHADAVDRTLGLLRLDDGTTIRANLSTAAITLVDKDGKTSLIDANKIRRIVALRPSIARTFDLQALHDCTYVGFMDTGIDVTSETAMSASARVRAALV